MTNKLFRTITLLAVFLCAVFFVGCRKIEKKVDTQETVRDDVVIFGIESETLDQHGSTSVATAIVMRNIYGNLYRRSPDGQIVSELAKSYTVNDDFTSYTFTLKDNLKFSDGSPLSAEDVAYTYNRGIESQVTYYIELEKVVALDEKTVQIDLAVPSALFLDDLTVEYMCIMSKAAIESCSSLAWNS